LSELEEVARNLDKGPETRPYPKKGGEGRVEGCVDDEAGLAG
jgi:hypothetical protein